jgi:DNA-binding SARP family transcriptional activator
MRELLEIQLLGSFLLKWENQEVRETLSPRAQILLAYILIHRHTPLSRRQIAFHFWPDSPEKQAFANLRNLLSHVRRTLPYLDRYLFVDRHSLQWLSSLPFFLDVDEFEKAASQGEFETAVSLYKGELLPDCYDDWIQPKRESLREDFSNLLEKLIMDLEATRNYERAIRYAYVSLNHDPLKESTYRQLMRLHALLGRRAQAAGIYQQCELILKTELGVETSSETRKVYRQIINTPQKERPSQANKNEMPLIGRDKEWGYLLKCWQAVDDGRPQMALLIGEAGIGKTRLLEEFQGWASRQGISTAYSRCYSTQGRMAYAPVAGWLRCPPVRDHLKHLEPVWLTEIIRLLPELANEFPDLPNPSPIQEGWQQMRLFEALARGIFSSSPPLLLSLDDLHWADRETISWISYLLRYSPDAELLILGSMRPEEPGSNEILSPLRLDLQRDGFITEFELTHFNREETQELAALMSEGSISPDEGKKIFSETEGNPLFIVEMVRNLETNKNRDSRRSSAGLFNSGFSLPGKVEAVIGSRISQLSGPAQALAALASACGRQFNFQVLEASWKSSEAELIFGLEELQKRRILREYGDESFDFTHDKIREAIYNRLSQAHRSLLHRTLAQSLERGGLGEIDSLSIEIANHWMKAGMKKQALPYLLKAGESAVRLYANQDAINYLRSGANIITSTPHNPDQTEEESQGIFKLFDTLGDVLVKVGEQQGAREVYELIFSYCPHLDPIRRAQTHRKIGQTWLAQQNFDRMLQDYNSAEEALGAIGEGLQNLDKTAYQLNWHREWLNIVIKKMWLHYWLGDPEKIQNLAEKALPTVEIYGTPYQRSDLYGCLSGMIMRQGNYSPTAEAINYMRQGLQAAVESGDESIIGFNSFGMGYSLLWAGELAEAEEHMLKSIAIAEKIGDEQTLVLTLSYLSFVYRKQGKVDKARQVIERSSIEAEKSKRDFYAAVAISNQAWLAWRQGDFRSARHLGESALETLMSAKVKFAFNWSAHWPVLGSALEEGDISTAVEHARGLLDPKQQDQPEEIKKIIQLGLNCWEQQCQEEAACYLRDAVSLACLMGYL